MNSSAKQILIGWIYRRIGFLKRGMKKQIKPLAAILRFLDFSIPHTVISSAARNLSCTLLFLAPSAEAFPFPAITHTTLSPPAERSLDFARDDVTEIALSKHIRCTLRGIDSFPPRRHEGRSEKSSLHSALSWSFRKRVPLFRAFLFPSQKHSRFLLSHIRRYTGVPERSLGFARDDDTEVALSKHIRCMLRVINPFPHTVISSAARNLPCTLLFLAPFTEGFPFSPSLLSHIGRYTSMQERSLDFARDDVTGSVFQTYPLYAT